MDKHFLHAPLEKNMPVLMGLLGVWNMSFMGYKTRTILPYAEALLKFPAHIQQVRLIGVTASWKGPGARPTAFRGSPWRRACVGGEPGVWSRSRP